MDDTTYSIVSTALLGVIALLLVVLIARIARLERTMRSRDVAPPRAEELRDDSGSPQVPSEPVRPEPIQDGESEEPFEKDGRWWYRRGAELLVYDEQSESWVRPNDRAGDREDEPAPHPLDEAKGWDTAPEQATAAPIPEPVAAPVASTSTPSEVQPTTPDDAAPDTGHWKCPACGVINGSTATSCRMCFAARP